MDIKTKRYCLTGENDQGSNKWFFDNKYEALEFAKSFTSRVGVELVDTHTKKLIYCNYSVSVACTKE